MAKTAPFYDTDRGWTLARQWLNYLRGNPLQYQWSPTDPRWSLKEAVRQATWHPDKYAAWKAIMRLRGEKV